MKNALGVPPRHLTDTLPFSASFESLPASFYTRLMPTPLPEPYLVCASASAAGLIDLDPAEFATPHFVETFTGNRIPTGAVPLAAVYSGHQFGVWAGQLGDGRAILLGEVPAPSTPYPGTLELQLKGTGPTPYFALGRRPRGVVLIDPRVPLFRGDGRAGHPDFTRAVRDRFRQTRAA